MPIVITTVTPKVAYTNWPLIEDYTNELQFIDNWQSGQPYGRGNGWGFKPDGTRMSVGNNTNDLHYNFDLITPWDFDTSGGIFGTQYGGVVPSDIWFAPDGLTYALHIRNNTIQFYTIDPDSVDYIGPFRPRNTNRILINTFNIDPISPNGDPNGVHVSRDGVHLIFMTRGNATDLFVHYIMSTPWDPATAVLQSDNYDPITQTSDGHVDISGDGMNMISSQVNTSTLFHYKFGTAWDLDTVSVVSTLASNVGNSCLVHMSDDAKTLLLGRENASTNFDISRRTFV